ncbi:TransThyretin-Related family domain [Caenorhabditis elegans]|nr:TransThyretin-Related family domain [Caenorhabditis elegans]CBW48392.1 TransThyretin-Related family domain [Caenorhabditis elegans]|eukprot:NP_001256934.1 TransThyretin-Related family domain [Caenorhabditis elegans]
MCRGRPYVGEMVQIWEPKIFDEMWSDQKTGVDGRFEMATNGNDVTLVDIPLLNFGFKPYLWINNFCGTEVMNGERCTKNLVKIPIPEWYVNPCRPDVHIFDIGVFEMDTVKGEDYNWFEKFLGYGKHCRSY